MASTVKAGSTRRRRTAAQIAQLDQQILDVLQSDRPQSIRHIFYCMTDPRLPVPVEKSDKGYRDVQRRCTEMRRASTLPYTWLADMTRHGFFTPTYSDESEFLESIAGEFRADVWNGASVIVEVWVESRSIASVLIDLCRKYAVDLYPCGGFSSITFVHEAAQELNYRLPDGGDVAIYYVGDLDPAGVLIPQNAEAELRLHLAPGINLSFIRLAITDEQVTDYDLPTKPRKVSDRRALHIKTAVEAEAMPAHILRSLVQSAIEAHLPPRALELSRLQEESARLFLQRIAAAKRKGLQH